MRAIKSPAIRVVPTVRVHGVLAHEANVANRWIVIELDGRAELSRLSEPKSIESH